MQLFSLLPLKSSLNYFGLFCAWQVSLEGFVRGWMSFWMFDANSCFCASLVVSFDLNMSILYFWTKVRSSGKFLWMNQLLIINYWPLFTFRVKSYRLGPTKSNLKHKHLTWTHLFESEYAIDWTLRPLKIISDRLNWLWLGATKSYLNKHRKSYPQGLWIRPMVGSSNDLHLAPPSLKKTTWTHLESSNICCLLPFWSQLCAWHDWGWQASQL